MNQEGKPDIQAMVEELAGRIQPALATDLDNQELSDDSLERVRQLELQAQKEEERIKNT
jgi:hypothetical protein